MKLNDYFKPKIHQTSEKHAPFFSIEIPKNTFGIKLDIIKFTAIGMTRQIHLVGKITLINATGKYDFTKMLHPIGNTHNKCICFYKLILTNLN